MTKYLIKESTLTNISKAIQRKLSKTFKMNPESMPGYIDSIVTGSSNAPDYVIGEVNRVVDQVNTLQNSNTITFLATSDIHYGSTVTDMEKMTGDLGHAITLLRNKIAFDFEADLGDKVWGNSGDPNEDVVREAIFVNDLMGYSPVRMSCVGNHDTYKTSTNQRYAFTNFLNYGAVYGDELNGYCYRDLPDKKIRIFLLNTSESASGTDSGSSIVSSNAQLKWLCSQLMAMDGMTDYQILFMSHMPPDWQIHLNIKSNVLKVLEAFELGNDYTIDGTTYTFSKIARPIIIGWCHGHIHNHKVRTVADIDTTRFCIPSAWKNRANEYSGTNANNATYMEYFGEPRSGEDSFGPDSYVFNTATSTALSVVVVNLETRKVSIINYGAHGKKGNREFVYGDADIVGIINNLANVINKNTSQTAVLNSRYYAVISPINDNYIVDSISVTMGGNSANQYVNGNVIDIPKVTGEIIITATGKAKIVYNVDNLLPKATTATSNEYYGEDHTGDGINDGYYMNRRVSESDSKGDGTYTNDLSGFIATGWIPYTPVANNEESAIYVRGGQFFLDNDGTDEAKYSRIFCWPDTKIPISDQGGSRAQGSGPTNHLLSNYYIVTRPEGENVNYYKFVPTFSNPTDHQDAFKYVRLSFKKVPDEDVIITIGQPIVASDIVTNYNVTMTLEHITSSNTVTSIPSNINYTTVLTPESNYEITSIVVMEGANDITTSAYNSVTGQITVQAPIKGNITITAIATAIPDEPSYVNQLSNAESYNAGAGTYGKDYNGDGVLDGYYIGTRLSENYANGDNAGANTGTSDSGGSDKFATGWIPYTSVADEDHAIYIKNAKIDTSDNHCRIYIYYSKTNAPEGGSTPTYASGAGIETHYTITKIKEDATNGEYYYKLVLKKDYAEGKYIRFSLKNTDKAPIITFGEPIE